MITMIWKLTGAGRLSAEWTDVSNERTGRTPRGFVHTRTKDTEPQRKKA